MTTHIHTMTIKRQNNYKKAQNDFEETDNDYKETLKNHQIHKMASERHKTNIKDTKGPKRDKKQP